ncbi:hypothetical protein A2U01_0056505, partial [Trifolium medium]|nr:hypothetical protein [Trifolium medium]
DEKEQKEYLRCRYFGINRRKTVTAPPSSPHSTTPTSELWPASSYVGENKRTSENERKE